TVVAVVMAMLRGLDPTSNKNTGAFVLIYGLCFMVGPLVALWAGLGLGKLALRVPVALALSAIPGIFPTFYFGGRMRLWFWRSVTLLQGAPTIGSLLVVRSCGFRLVRGKHPLEGALAADDVPVHDPCES